MADIRCIGIATGATDRELELTVAQFRRNRMLSAGALYGCGGRIAETAFMTQKQAAEHHSLLADNCCRPKTKYAPRPEYSSAR